MMLSHTIIRQSAPTITHKCVQKIIQVKACHSTIKWFYYKYKLEILKGQSRYLCQNAVIASTDINRN